MSHRFSDQNISEQLNKVLQKTIDNKYKCISNTFVIESQKSQAFAYFSITKQHQISLISININSKQQQIALVTQVRINKQISLQNLNVYVSQSPHVKQAYFLTFQNSTKEKGKSKSVFISTITLDRIKNQKCIQLKSILQKRQMDIKDIKWHPFAPFSLLILLANRILVFNFHKSIYETDFQINFNDCKVKNTNESLNRKVFEKISFAQELNQNRKYSSLGRKLSLFLINECGEIYLMFPFICSLTILDEQEKDELEKLISNPKPKRQIQLIKSFQGSSLSQTQYQDHQQIHSQRSYTLKFRSPVLPQIDIFKLKNLQPFKKDNNIVSIQTFHCLTIQRHSVFFYTVKTKKNKQTQNMFFVQTFSQDPYRLLLSSQNYSDIQNFTLENVGILKLEKTLNQNLSVQVFYYPNCNDIYLYFNHTLCYKICLNGLYKIIAVRDQDNLNDINLLQIDVMFQSKNQVVSLTNNQFTFYLIRHSNKGYSFTSIPIQSFELKQKIKKTNEQTQKLFKSLLSKSKELRQIKNQSKEKREAVSLIQLNEMSLQQLQQRLKSFTASYRAGVQRKIEKIKNLYEIIQQKKKKIQAHEDQKREIIQLVNKAQKNDQTIKNMIKSSSKQMTRKQKELERRLKASQKILEEIKSKLLSETYKVEEDRKKSEAMSECEEQANGILATYGQYLQNLKSKREELKRELGMV